MWKKSTEKLIRWIILSKFFFSLELSGTFLGSRWSKYEPKFDLIPNSIWKDLMKYYKFLKHVNFVDPKLEML